MGALQLTCICSGSATAVYAYSCIRRSAAACSWKGYATAHDHVVVGDQGNDVDIGDDHAHAHAHASACGLCAIHWCVRVTRRFSGEDRRLRPPPPVAAHNRLAAVIEGAVTL